jgi:hypothetical protein
MKTLLVPIFTGVHGAALTTLTREYTANANVINTHLVQRLRQEREKKKLLDIF